MTARRVWTSDLLWSVLIGIAFLVLLRATPDIPGGDDGYRHVKFASRLIRGQGALADPWRLAWFWPKPVDGWFGYHLLLSPFTLFFDLISAAKIFAAAVFTALAYVLFVLLRELGAVWRGIWVILALAGSSMALYRNALTRPLLLSLVLVLAALYFTLRGSIAGVFLISAAHSLSYSMFFLVGFAPALNLLLRRDRLAVRLFAACCAGMALGFAASPFFPENVRFDVAQLVNPLTRGPAHYLTMELRPLNWEWIEPARVAIVAWIGALAIGVWQRRNLKLAHPVWLLLAMCLAALAASLRVGRMFDLFVPLAVLFAATVVSPWMRLKPRNRHDVAAAFSVLLLLSAFNVSAAWRAVRKAPSAEHYRGVSQYLAAHRPGALVFNTQWEQYQFLYFWNSDDTYLVGIDPSFLYDRDRRHYFLWNHIANDEPVTCGEPRCAHDVSAKIPPAIVSGFNSRLVVLEHAANPQLERILRAAPARELYRDQWCSLFELLM